MSLVSNNSVKSACSNTTGARVRKQKGDGVRINIGSCNIIVSFHGKTMDPLIVNLGATEMKYMHAHLSSVHHSTQTQFCQVLHIDSKDIPYII